MRSIGFARVAWGFVLVSCGLAYDPDDLSKGSPAGGSGGGAGAVTGGAAGVGSSATGGAGGALGGSSGLGGGGALGGSSGLGGSGGLGGDGATGGTSSGGTAGAGGVACGQPGEACCSTGLACPTNNNKAQCCNNCTGFPDFQCTCNLSYKADGVCRLCCIVCKDGTASTPQYVGPSDTCDGTGSVFCTGKGGVEASKTGWKKSCT